MMLPPIIQAMDEPVAPLKPMVTWVSFDSVRYLLDPHDIPNDSC